MVSSKSVNCSAFHRSWNTNGSCSQTSCQKCESEEENIRRLEEIRNDQRVGLVIILSSGVVFASARATQSTMNIGSRVSPRPTLPRARLGRWTQMDPYQDQTFGNIISHRNPDTWRHYVAPIDYVTSFYRFPAALRECGSLSPHCR